MFKVDTECGMECYHNNIITLERLGMIIPSKSGGGGTPYNGLYLEAPPERGPFFTLQVYERVGKSVI